MLHTVRQLDKKFDNVCFVLVMHLQWVQLYAAQHTNVIPLLQQDIPAHLELTPHCPIAGCSDRGCWPVLQ